MSKYDSQNERFRFSSKALANDTFLVVRFSGTEGFNTLYHFEITLMSENSEIVLPELLIHPATFIILREDGQHAYFSGYPSACSQGAHSNGWTFYTLTLQPMFWKLTCIPYNRIDLDLNTQGIVEQAMAADATFKPEHEFNLQGTYIEQEFSMQYNESLYDYIAAKLERDGIYYYFDQTDACEKIIFVDSLSCHEPLKDSPKLIYSPTSGLEHPYREEVISSFIQTCTALPKKVYVRDYDWQRPNTPIEAEAPVSDIGLGDVYYYGDGFVTTEEGGRIAKIRAEELICQSKIYIGLSQVPTLRPGFIFELEEHYANSFNQEYLVTEVNHEGSQEGYLSLALGIQLLHPSDKVFYRNDFKAIPANVQFRPKRTTQRPKISGYLTAFVDASDDSRKPELDGLGRYKVIFPQGSSGREAGKASCWLRRAQASVGSGFGTSFPLTPGVEVLVSFLDGNPDKPLIASAVANAEVGSVDTAATSLLTGISSSGGGALLFNDSDEKQGISLSSGSKRSGTIMSSGSVGATFEHAEHSLLFSSAVDTSMAAFSKSSMSGFENSLKVGGTEPWNKLWLTLLSLATSITTAGKKIDPEGKENDAYIVWESLAEGCKLTQSIIDCVDAKKNTTQSSDKAKKKAEKRKKQGKAPKEEKPTPDAPYSSVISAQSDKSAVTLQTPMLAGKINEYLTFTISRLTAQLANEAFTTWKKIAETETKKDNGDAKFRDKVRKDKKYMAAAFGLSGSIQALTAEIIAMIAMRNKKHAYWTAQKTDFGGIKMVALEDNVAIASATETRVTSNDQLILSAQSESIDRINNIEAEKLPSLYSKKCVELGGKDENCRVIIHSDDVRSIAMKTNDTYSLDSAKLVAANTIEISNKPTPWIDIKKALENADCTDNTKAKSLDESFEQKNIEIPCECCDIETDEPFSSVTLHKGGLYIHNHGGKMELLQGYTDDKAATTITRAKKDKKDEPDNQLEFKATHSKLSYKPNEAAKQSSVTLIDKTATISAGDVDGNAGGSIILTNASCAINIKDASIINITENDINLKSTSVNFKVDEINLKVAKTINASVDKDINIKSNGDINIKSSKAFNIKSLNVNIC